MPRQRPGSVTAAAVLALIYGCIFTLCNLCGVFSVAAQGSLNKNLFGGNDPQQAQLQKQMQELLERDIPGYRAVQIIAPIIGLLFALALLCAGLGLFGMYSWARLLAIVTTVFIVLFNILQTIYQLVFMIPAMNRVFTEVLPNAMQKGPAPPPPGLVEIMRASVIAGTVIGVLIQLAVIVYLLIIVFLLMRRNVRLAFAGGDLPEVADGLSEHVQDLDEGWGKSAPPKKPEDDWRIQ